MSAGAIMIFPIFAFWAAAQVAGITGPYQTLFVAFDQRGYPLYKRAGYVFLGPPEQLGDRPLPPDDLTIQGVDIDLHITTVHGAELCAPIQQAPIVEIGRTTYWGCEEKGN